MRSDETLFESWRAGDRRSGQELFERYAGDLYRFFGRKTGVAVEDLIQQTMLRSLEHASRIRGGSAFRPFLYGVARNVLYEHIRRVRKSRDHIDFATTSLADVELGPPSILEEKQDRRILLRALRTIPLDSQMLIELYFWGGMSGPAMAEVFAIPEGTVRSRLRRGLASLRGAVERVRMSPAALESTSTTLAEWAHSVRRRDASEAAAE